MNKTYLLKRIFIFIAAIILVFQGVGSFLDVDSVKAQGDITAPTLKSVEVDKKEATLGDTVTVKVTAEDKESGIKSVWLDYRSPVTGKTQFVSLRYNAQSGKYEGTINIDEYSESGEWTINDLYIADNAGNSNYITSDEKFSGGSFTVTGTNADITSPILKSVEVDKKEATLGDTVTVKVTAEDKESGIKSVWLDYRSPVTGKTQFVSLVYNAQSGKYEGTISIDQYSESGEWTINDLYIADSAGNSNYITSGEELSGGTFKVVDPSSSGIEALDQTVVQTTQTWTSKTINGDVYIGPNAVLTINGNVKINGNVYVLGSMKNYGNLSISGSLHASRVNWGYSILSNGTVLMLGGTNTINSMFVSNRVLSDIPFTIYTDPIISKDGIISLTGATLPIGNLFMNDQKVTLNGDGTFKIDQFNIGDSENVVFKFVDVLGNEIIKSYPVQISDTIKPTASADTKDGIYYKGTSVVLSMSEKGNIYYTTNGSVPSKASTLYSKPIELNKDTELQYIAIDRSGNKSKIYKKQYHVFTVNDINDQSSAVTGNASNGTTITVKTDAGTLSGKTEGNGTYSINISKQEAGTVLLVVATDQVGNSSKAKQITVKDSTAPTFSGVEDKTISAGISFDAKAGVKAKDNVDGDLTGKIEISGTVNVKAPGEYKVKYNVSDKAGNTTQAERKITVKDNTAPIFSGIEDKTISVGTSFDAKAGVKAKDNVDGDLTAKIGVSGTVNSQKSGKYTLTYNVTDKAGNKAEVKRIVVVVEETKPFFQHIDNLTIAAGSSFNSLSNVKATDKEDGDLTKSIKVAGTVNTKRPGKYTLVYTVTDKAGNKVEAKRMVTVADKTKPVLQNVGSTTIAAGSKFNAMTNVKAIDNVDGDLTKSIKVTGSVNTQKLGKYTLTYTVADKAGNKAEVKRMVTVADKTKPVLQNVGSTTIAAGSKFNAMANVKATDTIDGTITKNVKVSGTVNANKVGNYTLTYTITDRAGNKTTAKRVITVKDKTKPVISGAANKTIKKNSSFNVKTGVTAKDNIDGNLTSKIKVSGSVNTKRAGVYTLTYTVADKASNKSEVKRKITVK